jgi:hypothetical protein
MHRCCRLILAFVTVGIRCAYADQIDPEQMRLINDTSATICNTVEHATGESSRSQVCGEVSGQLKGLLGRLAQAGMQGTGTLTTEQYDGLTRDAAAIALNGDRDCRERLFDKMFDTLSGMGKQKQTSKEIPVANMEISGDLIPGTEPTPSNACTSRGIGEDRFKVLIGDNGLLASEDGQLNALVLNGCVALSIHRGEAGILVSASLFDKERNHVVKIDSNKITTLNGEDYKSRQNEKRSTLTVSDKSGNRILFVDFINKTTLQVRGFFGCEPGKAVLVRDDQPIPGFFMKNSCLGGRNAISINGL